MTSMMALMLSSRTATAAAKAMRRLGRRANTAIRFRSLIALSLLCACHIPSSNFLANMIVALFDEPCMFLVVTYECATQILFLACFNEY